MSVEDWDKQLAPMGADFAPGEYTVAIQKAIFDVSKKMEPRFRIVVVSDSGPSKGETCTMWYNLVREDKNGKLRDCQNLMADVWKINTYASTAAQKYPEREKDQKIGEFCKELALQMNKKKPVVGIRFDVQQNGEYLNKYIRGVDYVGDGGNGAPKRAVKKKRATRKGTSA